MPPRPSREPRLPSYCAALTDTPDPASSSSASGPAPHTASSDDARLAGRTAAPADDTGATPAEDTHSPSSLRQRFGEAASVFGKLDTRPFDERNRPAPWWSRWLRRR